MSNLSYRCYILPVTGMIVYLIFALPSVKMVFRDWIPDYYYAMVIQSLMVLIILFITCRAMDILWDGPCPHTNAPVTMAEDVPPVTMDEDVSPVIMAEDVPPVTMDEEGSPETVMEDLDL